MTEQFSVKKTDKPIDWTVTVPGSKSMTNRALLMAALTDGTVQRMEFYFRMTPVTLSAPCSHLDSTHR